MSRRTTTRKYIDEPTMSDKSLLISVEDLIGMAMGSSHKNTVNYKMIQTVLYILARQLRLLEQQVELRTDMVLEPMTSVKLTKEEKAAMKPRKREDGGSSREDGGGSKEDRDGSKVDRGGSKKDRGSSKGDRGGSKEDKGISKGVRGVSKVDRGGFTDRDNEKGPARGKGNAERAEGKDREREERARSKESDKDERRSAKEKVNAEKEVGKGKTREEKEKEKAERGTSRELDRERRDEEKTEQEREMEKTEAKERKGVDKDRDKADKSTAKETEKMGKATGKEAETMGRATAKEREKLERERDKADKAEGKGIEDSSKLKELRSQSPKGPAGIAITETKKGKDKVLVVEKGPTTYADSRTRVGSIEVVTRSQFELLKDVVHQLAAKSGPLPSLALPDNEKLRDALAKGTASLTDMMQALQVTARVAAAEDAISRMADLLTQLAATGVLPEDVASRVVIGLHEAMIAAAEGAARMQPAASGAEGRPFATPRAHTTDIRSAEVTQSITPRKSVGIDMGSLKPGAARPSMGTRPSMAASKSMAAGLPSAMSAVGSDGPCVSHQEMDDSLQGLRGELNKNIQSLTAKATGNADVAANLSRAVAEKLDNAMNLDNRISTLYSLTSDYAEQLSGFDAGLTTQMLSFQEQMAQMRADLKGGLDVLDTANNNAETAAVMELTERYEGLASDLDRTAHAHQSLTTFQKQLGDELKSMVECVEMLREQKADRDEVQDGLKDKADIARLEGLLREEDFAEAREAMEARLALCYEKFNRQDAVWLCALRDLSLMAESKAEYLQLMALRENTEDQINDMDEQLRQLADILGEPKAAILTRKLSRDATCGVCMVPALMDMEERSYAAPAALPPLLHRPQPLGQEGPCLTDWQSDDQHLKGHVCKRWVGGSHTLVTEAATRGRAPPTCAAAATTRRYTAIGDDGQLYMMEDELQPCMECNQLLYERLAEAEDEAKNARDASPAPETGAGDQEKYHSRQRTSNLNKEDEK